MRFSTKQLAVMAMLIAFNVAMGVVHVIKLPIFIDAIRTIIAILVVGVIPGIVVSILRACFENNTMLLARRLTISRIIASCSSVSLVCTWRS
jgi:hypothetical protein